MNNQNDRTDVNSFRKLSNSKLAEIIQNFSPRSKVVNRAVNELIHRNRDLKARIRQKLDSKKVLYLEENYAEKPIISNSELEIENDMDANNVKQDFQISMEQFNLLRQSDSYVWELVRSQFTPLLTKDIESLIMKMRHNLEFSNFLLDEDIPSWVYHIADISWISFRLMLTKENSTINYENVPKLYNYLRVISWYETRNIFRKLRDKRGETLADSALASELEGRYLDSYSFVLEKEDHPEYQKTSYEFIAHLIEILNTLEPKYKQVFTMQVLYEKSTKEIANELGFTEQSIRTILFKIRNIMRNRLRDSDKAEDTEG